MFFYALTFAGSRGRFLNTRLSAQTSPERPASVNAMKQTCVIVILAYFTFSNSNEICTENAVKTLKYPYSYTEFL